jgi:hypothetical protein
VTSITCIHSMLTRIRIHARARAHTHTHTLSLTHTHDNNNSERAWTYATADWADAHQTSGEPDADAAREPSTDLLAFRFKSKDEALMFKNVFERCCAASALRGPDPDGAGRTERGPADEGAGAAMPQSALGRRDGGRHTDMTAAGEDDGSVAPTTTLSEAIQPPEGELVGGRRAPLILRKGFWEEEGGGGNHGNGAPLLRRNAGFLADPLSPPGPRAGAGGREVCSMAQELNALVLSRGSKWVGKCDGAQRWLEPSVEAPKMAPLPEGVRVRRPPPAFPCSPLLYASILAPVPCLLARTPHSHTHTHTPEADFGGGCGADIPKRVTATGHGRLAPASCRR